MSWDTPSSERIRLLAPEAFAALAAMESSACRGADPVLIELVRSRVEGMLGARDTTVASCGSGIDERTPLVEAWRTSAAFTPYERACLATTEQFVMDVGSTSDDQRATATQALGADLFDFVQTLYVLDYRTRMRAAWQQLFGPGIDPLEGSVPPGPSALPVTLWPTIESFLSTVARMGALDPLTTELVRLRGARAHACRLCKSLRSLRAANAGADESTYEMIDRYETSDLPERHKVALRLTDAILWEPTRYPAQLVDQVRHCFSPTESVEIVFDVARNAANKIAVTLGADTAHVSDGVEYFDTDAHGDLLFGVTCTGD